MTGEIHEFDARVGGGYRMSLFYPPDERVFRGKTSDSEDMVNVRFVELAPPHRIVEAVSFVTTDACLDQMPARSSVETGRCGGTLLSVSIRLIRVGPPICGIHGSQSGSCRDACDHRRGWAAPDRRRYRGPARGLTGMARRPRRWRQSARRDADIDKAPIGETAMGQECIERHDAFLAES
jgi:hypothetical protein